MPEGGLQSNSTGLMNKLPPLNSSSGGITESQLLQLDKITPEDVKRLNCITEGEYYVTKMRVNDSHRKIFDQSKRSLHFPDFS